MTLAKGCLPCPDEAQGDTSLEGLLGAAPAAVAVQPKLDLSWVVRSRRDQGPFGTCVGFGTNNAAHSCARQAGFAEFPDMSDLGTYKQARAIERMLKHPQDGSTIDAAIRALAAGGYLFEKEYPYSQLDKDPELRRKGFKLGKGQAALRRCGLRAHRIQTLVPLDQLVLTCQTLLCTGKGIEGGWLINQGFEDWVPSQGPWDGLCATGEGHCMALLDYPNGNPRLDNSWGPDKGDNGFYEVTWRVIQRARSLWAIDFVP